MNPLTNVRNLNKANELELEYKLRGQKSSWHDVYKDSAWIFFGGVSYDLTEGDLICVFSQYGEVMNINLIRDKGTGKSKGFGFLCYYDQRSTVLAVDNFNGTKIAGRILRVDHVEEYKVPKPDNYDDDPTKKVLHMKGCAPGVNVEKAVRKLEKQSQKEKEEDVLNEQKLRHIKEEKRSHNKSRKIKQEYDSDGDINVGSLAAAKQCDSDDDLNVGALMASKVKKEPRSPSPKQKSQRRSRSRSYDRSEKRHKKHHSRSRSPRGKHSKHHHRSSRHRSRSKS